MRRSFCLTLLGLVFGNLAGLAQPAKSPVFHDPANTIIFPQAVIGRVGDSFFDIEIRIVNTNPSVDFIGNLFLIGQDGGVAGAGGGCQIQVIGTGEGSIQEIPVLNALGPLQGDLAQSYVTTVYQGNGAFYVGLSAVELSSACEDGVNPITVGIETESGPQAAGSGFFIDDLIVGFYYNLRDLEGRLIDKIAVPPSPSRAASRIRYVTGRSAVFDIGAAIFVTVPGSNVRVRVDLPAGIGPVGSGAGNVLETSFPISGFQDAFFLFERFQDFPMDIPAALVEITLEGPGNMYVVALGLQVENGTIQIASQPVENVPVIR